MFEGKRILALIPARGGSKGLPGKNILPLHGKPLIAWSIEAALACDFLDLVLVSTDDPEIRGKAIEYGAEAPFLRPAELAIDTAGSMETIFHALDWLEEKGQSFDFLLLLQPTSPLRTGTHIRQALELMFEKNGDGVVSVCEVDHHPAWMNTLSPDKNMAGFMDKRFQNVPRQQLPRYYRINGALYLASVGSLRKVRSFFSDQTFALLMSREESVDIDDQLDFDLAELLLQRKIIGVEKSPTTDVGQVITG